MITLKCFNDVVMTDGSIAFKAGESYQFSLKSNGNIERFTDNGLHKFMCYGPDKWANYFKYELEDV